MGRQNAACHHGSWCGHSFRQFGHLRAGLCHVCSREQQLTSVTLPEDLSLHNGVPSGS